METHGPVQNGAVKAIHNVSTNEASNYGKKNIYVCLFFSPLEQGQTKEESPRVERITDFIFEALVLPEILNCNTCFFCALQVTNNCTGELWL